MGPGEVPHPGIELLNDGIEAAVHHDDPPPLPHRPDPNRRQERVAVGHGESFDSLSRERLVETADEVIIQALLVGISHQRVELGGPVAESRVHQPAFGNGLVRQSQHLPLPALEGLDRAPDLHHILVTGVSE